MKAAWPWLAILIAAIIARCEAAPSVLVTNLSVYGSYSPLSGVVLNANPATNAVAIYIYVPGYGWVTKPTCAQPLTTVQPDGSWSANVTTGGAGDATAARFAALLVSTNFNQACVLGSNNLPANLYAQAIAKTIVTRPSPGVRFLSFCGYDWWVKNYTTPVGPGPNRLGPGEFSGGAERDPAIDALSGLGDSAANLVEISGVIKWFDASKGYGFVVPDNGWPDVLLHVTVLRRDGYQTAYEGARLVCECVQRAKGYQAFRILSMDESTAIHPAQMLPPRTHVSVTPTSGLERAQVKWFNRLRGFGFLTCGEGTPDIFVHMETLRRFGMTELRPGQYVLVRFGPGSKGMMAAEIQPETGSPGLSSH